MNLVIKFEEVENCIELFNHPKQYDLSVVIRNGQPYKVLRSKLARSEYFKKYTYDEQKMDETVCYLNLKSDCQAFVKVLKCFYGEEIIINDYKELQQISEILLYLKIAELLKQMYQYITSDENLHMFGLQLAEQNNINELNEYFKIHLQKTGFVKIFKAPYDYQVARLQYNQDSIPLNYLFIQPNLLKKLIELHNALQKKSQIEDQWKFLEQNQLAQKISEFCKVQGFGHIIQLKELLHDTVKLTPQEYDSIISEYNNYLSQDYTFTQQSFESNGDLSINFQQDCYNSDVINKEFIDQLIGKQKLIFKFYTQYTWFGFYVSVPVMINQQLEDENLFYFNQENTQIRLTPLKIHRIKFENDSINVDNRLIINGTQGISRFDDECDKPEKYQLSGQRKFIILSVEYIVLFSLCIMVLSSGHLRNNKLNNKHKSLAQTNQVVYIDDDKEFGQEQEAQPQMDEQPQAELQTDLPTQNEQVEETKVEVYDENEQVVLTKEQQEQLDQEEQRRYEETQKSLMAAPKTDDPQYLAQTDITIQSIENEEMPIDVVEHQLTPNIQPLTLPDQRGLESPFAPADGGAFLPNDTETGFEVQPIQFMDGEVPVDKQ
ncbi:hypothetical protein pb186bvf_010286 [Paramecium bursaria]